MKFKPAFLLTVWLAGGMAALNVLVLLQSRTDSAKVRHQQDFISQDRLRTLLLKSQKGIQGERDRRNNVSEFYADSSVIGDQVAPNKPLNIGSHSLPLAEVRVESVGNWTVNTSQLKILPYGAKDMRKDDNYLIQERSTQCFPLKSKDQYQGNWFRLELDFHEFMARDPQRHQLAFALLCLVGRGGTYLEIGSRYGQFTDLMVTHSGIAHLHVVDPESVKFPSFQGRLSSWKKKLGSKHVHYHAGFSTDESFLRSIPDGSVDMIYHDALHDYGAVRTDLLNFWKKLKIGGIYSGHDYCVATPVWLKSRSKWEKIGVPDCGKYTVYDAGEKGEYVSKSAGKYCKTQEPVVHAVHDVSPGLGAVFIYSSLENFTRTSAGSSMYSASLSKTRNPSWYFIKNARRHAAVAGKGYMSPVWGRGDPMSAIGIRCEWTGWKSPLMTTKSKTKSKSIDGTTVVVIYRDNPRYLMQQLKNLHSFSTPLEILVIDDSSKTEAASFVSNYASLNFRIIRITTRIDWNDAGAWNLGVYEAKYASVVLLGFESIVSDVHIQDFQLQAKADPKNVVVFPLVQGGPVPGAIACSHDTFWQLGGFDEDFAGCPGAVFEHFLQKAEDKKVFPVVQKTGVSDFQPPTKECLEGSGEECYRTRGSLCNQQLLAWKLSTKCWANSFLRFAWTEVQIRGS